MWEIILFAALAVLFIPMGIPGIKEDYRNDTGYVLTIIGCIGLAGFVIFTLIYLNDEPVKTAYFQQTVVKRDVVEKALLVVYYKTAFSDDIRIVASAEAKQVNFPEKYDVYYETKYGRSGKKISETPILKEKEK